MKQKLDEVRTLAVQLFESSQRQKRKQRDEIWGREAKLCGWRDLPSESVAVWDAVAIEAFEKFAEERNRYRAVCERLVNRWDKQSPTWPIVDIVEMAREALKGGKA